MGVGIDSTGGVMMAPGSAYGVTVPSIIGEYSTVGAGSSCTESAVLKFASAQVVPSQTVVVERCQPLQLIDPQPEMVRTKIDNK